MSKRFCYLVAEERWQRTLYIHVLFSVVRVLPGATCIYGWMEGQDEAASVSPITTPGHLTNALRSRPALLAWYINYM